MNTPSVTAAVLKRLEPLGSLSADSLREISRMCYLEKVSRNLDPFRLQGLRGQAVYLLKGELKLDFPDASSEILVGGTEAALRPLDRIKPAFTQGKAITDIELVRIDEEVLDIMLTWDQLAAPQEKVSPRRTADVDQTDWRTLSGMFAAENLTRGIFASLPPANIETLFKRFQRIKAGRGESIIREGEEGDFYYVIESGRCTVSRRVGGASVELAELKTGDAFGEDALVADTRRNASVAMKTEGALLRLAKADFVALLKEPLLQRLSRSAAEARMAAGGAVWLDVRFPAEYNDAKLPGAINIPLNEIRNAVGSLDRQKEYIVYCQSGRRSSAAAFLLSQRGYRAYLLEGGLCGLAT